MVLGFQDGYRARQKRFTDSALDKGFNPIIYVLSRHFARSFAVSYVTIIRYNRSYNILNPQNVRRLAEKQRENAVEMTSNWNRF